MNAEVVYMFALDIAQEADLAKIERLLSGSAELHSIGRLKDTPPHFPVYRPLSIQVDDVSIKGPLGPMKLSASVKIFAIGAISLKLRVPVKIEKLSDLLPYRHLRFNDGSDMERRVMEMANLQLEELRTYDMYLDKVLDKAYDEVELASRLKSWFSRQKMLRELRGIRMDLSKVTDEITNISKFFGEWHLARIYMGCASRFHLSEWENAVNQKLHALDSLYSILQQDTFNWIMFLLEAAIVALFIIDLIIIIALAM